MRKNKLLVLVIFVALIGLLIFIEYIHKYQQVVNEGSYLADEHCIKINPLIIDRKNKYLDQYNIILAGTATTEEFMASLEGYKQASKAYLREEEIWLMKQRKYLDSKDFNFLMPDYLKELAKYQYQLYESQYKSSFYLMQEFEEKNHDRGLELSNMVMEENTKSKEAEDRYQNLWKDVKGKSDWHYHFVKVPEAKCPRENYNMPEIPNLFAPPVITNSPNS